MRDWRRRSPSSSTSSSPPTSSWCATTTHDLPKIVVHAGELNQVWTNLIHNAIQALGDSGTLTITTRRDGPCVRVDVADTGPGIDPAVRERIFEPFFTTKDVGQGTGLGLDTARRIVVDRTTAASPSTASPVTPSFTSGFRSRSRPLPAAPKGGLVDLRTPSTEIITERCVR